jgi:hypothetical protein
VAELSTQDRNKLKDSDFAYIDRKGERHLPIHDEEHVRNAISRWNQTDFESAEARENARKSILSAARKHSIEVADDDWIAKKAK